VEDYLKKYDWTKRCLLLKRHVEAATVSHAVDKIYFQISSKKCEVKTWRAGDLLVSS
jgi:hypothetical protein